MVRGFVIIVMAWLSMTLNAQEMRISQFSKLKKGLLNRHHVTTDKQQAILDLKTGEKGFSFLADGKTDIQAEEGDGVLTLKTPHKTTFIVIKHTDYGQLTWKVPEKKGLRKKKHYEAILLTFSPEKEYKLQQQWVLFEIQPKDAILTIDSTMTAIHDGKAQFYLPIGEHNYLVESPFHQQEEGTFELNDEERQIVSVALQPFYSYLTVRTPLDDGDIWVDGQLIGRLQGTSGHLHEGKHRLVVQKGHQRYYDAYISIGKSEKKTIELTTKDLYPRSKTTHTSHSKAPAQAAADSSTTTSTIYAPVSITAIDDSTGIWINRELKGFGSWEGELEAGFYLINTEKDGMESRSTTLWIDDNTQKNIELLAPMASYGMLNVHCNEIGAEVYVNGKLAGTTPCVVKGLPADRKCQVRLVKAGFRHAEKTIRVLGNDLTDVKLKLKKKR